MIRTIKDDIKYGKLPETREQLIALRLCVEEDLHAIELQVTEAKRRAAAEGIYSDRDWLRRAEAALRHKKLLVQRIQLQLSKLKSSKTVKIETAFMDAARELLLPETFDNILTAAHERIKMPSEREEG